jgi:hypothetical protein
MTEDKKTEKTVDDLLTEGKVQEQKEFDEAFEEIIDEDKDLQKDLSDDANGHLNKDDEKGTALAEQHKKDEEAKKKAEAEEAAKKEQEGLLKGPADTDKTAGTDGTDGDGTATDETDPVKKLQAENKQIKADLAAERQRNASWEGRISAANTRADEAEARAKEAAEAKAKKKDEEDQTASEDDDKVLSQFYSDFPELEAPLKILLKKHGSENTAAVLEEIKPSLKKVDEVAETQKETADSEHVSQLRTAHPDIEKIAKSGVMLDWIETQPSYLKPGLLKVYQNGSTQDAIDLISEFKRVTGYGKTKETNTNEKDKTDTDKDAKLKSMMQVDSDSSGPPAGEPDKSDYDSAAKDAGL